MPTWDDFAAAIGPIERSMIDLAAQDPPDLSALDALACRRGEWIAWMQANLPSAGPGVQAMLAAMIERQQLLLGHLARIRRAAAGELQSLAGVGRRLEVWQPPGTRQPVRIDYHG